MSEIIVQKGWWGTNTQNCILYGEVKKKGNVFQLVFHDQVREVGYDQMSYIESIIGYNINGKKVTLFDCYQTSKKYSGLIDQYTYLVALILEGEHYSSRSSVKASRISCQYTNLYAWLLGVRNVKKDFAKGKLILEYNEPKKIIDKIDKNKKLEFTFSNTVPGWSIQQDEYGFKIYSYFWWINTRKQSLMSLISSVNSFQNFLSFICQRPSFPTDIRIKRVGSEPHQEIEFPIGLSEYEKKVSDRFQILLTHDEIIHLIPDYFDKWLTLESKYSESLNLYLETLYNPYLSFEKKIFNLVTALESYHRYAMHSHRMSLIDRLKNIHMQFKDAFNGVTKINYSDSFYQKVADTRNFHAHILPNKEKKRLRGNKLVEAIRKLKIINMSWILYEFGIERKTIKVILKNRFY